MPPAASVPPPAAPGRLKTGPYGGTTLRDDGKYKTDFRLNAKVRFSVSKKWSLRASDHTTTRQEPPSAVALCTRLRAQWRGNPP